MDGGSGEGGAEPDAPDGMVGEDLAEGHEEALAGLIFGLIGWADEDVFGFEGFPDFWRGIGEAAVGEGVGGEQEAEVVWQERVGRGKQREGDVPAGVAAPHDHPVPVVTLQLGGCHPAGVLVAGVRGGAVDHGYSSLPAIFPAAWPWSGEHA